MDIKFNKIRLNARKLPLDSDSPLIDRIGFWAVVDEVNSMTNRVNVYSDTGILVKGLPVVSNEWVSPSSDERKYITGSRNLPPVGARVFVLMPTHTIAGAFILCSGFAAGEVNTHELYAKEEDKKTFNTVQEKITQGGWREKEDYTTGNRSIESKDGSIKVELNLEKNNRLEQEKGIIITAYDNVITINPDKKITITSKQEVVVDASDQKVTLVASKFSVKSDVNGQASLEVT